jgi:flagellar motor component MotA
MFSIVVLVACMYDGGAIKHFWVAFDLYIIFGGIGSIALLLKCGIDTKEAPDVRSKGPKVINHINYKI